MADLISKLDDPDHISAFLRMIGGSPKLSRSLQKIVQKTDSTASDENQPPSKEDMWEQEEAAELDKKETLENESAGNKTPAVRSRAPSSAASTPFQPGINAPPPTPATGAATIDNTTLKLDPIEEDESGIWAQLADASNKTLKDSKYATKGNLRYLVPEFKFATLPRNFSPPKQSPTVKISAPSIHLSPTAGYMDQVIGQFHEKLEPAVKANLKHIEPEAEPEAAEAKLTYRESEEMADMVGHQDRETLQRKTNKDKAGKPEAVQEVDANDVESNREERKENTTTVNGNQLRKAVGFSWPALAPATERDAIRARKIAKPARTVPETPSEKKISQDVAIAAQSEPPENAGPARDEREAAYAGSFRPDLIQQVEEEEHENREHLTHFKSWGAQVARSRPAARVRKVTISGLPADVTDLSLVQGLISGGSIDEYILASSCTVAHVTFASADACDAFCKTYPNVLSFKYHGRSYTAFVEKGKEVDNISGMLQGFIEAGASRCVRATGADEDWGMRALHKLAEGKSRKGKVESIQDVLRIATGIHSLTGDGSPTPKKIRTIIFRFTSISDAVQFRGMLLREEDWEGCNIQFMDDPCAKATGVHLD